MSKVYFLCFVLNRTIELPSGINWEDACHNRNHNHYPRHGTKLTSLQIHIVLFLDHYSPHCKNNCGKRKTIICISGHQAIDLLTGYQTTRQLVDRECVRHYTNGAGQSRICGVGNCSSKTGSRRQSEKKPILKHFLKEFLLGWN